ncbi:hypothetical protein O181_051911 [Austropuccinia psidii MF-1]|uniref:Uncharacterized protein n=1 Tax=Austropuccinia psidii MF-1 TaxID=1389203 RepID=A0A9Q3E4L9_9BASI|nr:hypothetical protein [Austropuccinia psidii MF-1]
MSLSNPCKSHSGSVHDSDSESSIEYVLTTQSPMSPNITLTTPIASLINVSCLNIDVGHATSQSSSTWSITNISLTPIPPNPTNTQMHVSEGPGSTPEISPKANPQDFLLNPGWNPVAPRNPLGEPVDVGQKKRPLENAPWSGLSEGNPGLKLHQSDELYASSPLVHKENVTGPHHPYASKLRMGLASSSREKIVDDEDENMSLTQSKTND